MTRPEGAPSDKYPRSSLNEMSIKQTPWDTNGNADAALPRTTQLFPVLASACSSVLRLFLGVLFRQLFAKIKNFAETRPKLQGTTKTSQDSFRICRRPRALSARKFKMAVGEWHKSDTVYDQYGGNSFCPSSFPGAVLWSVFLVGKDSTYDRNWKEEEDFGHFRQFLEGNTRKTSWGFQNSYVECVTAICGSGNISSSIMAKR